MKPVSPTMLATAYMSLMLVGCGQQTPSAPDLGGPGGIHTWSAPGEIKNPLPGIDRASIYHEGSAFAVWGDFDGGGGGSSSSNAQGLKCQGQLKPHGGRPVEFRWETKDGKAGRVTIDGADYDFADGGLFLISPRGGDLRVKQLKRDMSKLKFDRESLKAFARGDPEIGEFFAGPAQPK